MEAVPALATLIGVISDTHGLLRQDALRALRGCDLVVHAGDVGSAGILHALRAMAPVIAVRGNVDTEEWALDLPLREVVEANGARLYVLHNLKDLDVNPRAAGCDVVISGHTHRPGQFEKDGVLYINPGSAGPRRFDLPIGVARLRVGERPWQVDFLRCEENPSSGMR
jgi:putative phosphoesterase